MKAEEVSSELAQALRACGVEGELEQLEVALTHKSYANEYKRWIEHNELLEFLGDAILGFAITSHLYKTFTGFTEGELSARKAALVSAVTLAKVGADLRLSSAIRLAKGEQRNGGGQKESILANTVEALFGAVYLHSGTELAVSFVLHVLHPYIEQIRTNGLAPDPKTQLQQLAASVGLPHPQYSITSEGPDHCKTFTARVELFEESGTGVGPTKKAAAQQAASELVKILEHHASSRKSH